MTVTAEAYRKCGHCPRCRPDAERWVERTAGPAWEPPSVDCWTAYLTAATMLTTDTHHDDAWLSPHCGVLDIHHLCPGHISTPTGNLDCICRRPGCHQDQP